MQDLIPADGEKINAICRALQPERIGRYLPVADKDQTLAFKFYLWNCELCEAFYLPLHFCEIVCRNAIHGALVFRLGKDWFNNATFRNLLGARFLTDLDDTITTEQGAHGAAMTCHHVVSSLTFGFWEHLATKRFERLLWNRGIRHNFPNAPHDRKVGDLHALIESARRWRNRIAHHSPIFDKSPTRKHQDAMDLIGWVCTDTAAWVQSASRVPAIIGRRPK